MRARHTALAAALAVALGSGVFAQQMSLTLTSATPNIGAHVLTISGTGFGSSMPVVTLAAAPLTVISWSDTAIDALLPDIVPGGYNVVVARIDKGRVVTSGSMDVSIGVLGVKGPVGPAGPAGPIGDAGQSGATGLAGQAGETGPAGPAGQAGSAGPTGLTGPAGQAGPTGPAGASLAFGSITGRALGCDATTPAAGAHALIGGTSFEATVGDDGRFVLLHVTPGTYTVGINTAGASATRANVDVTDGSSVNVGDVVVCNAQQ